MNSDEPSLVIARRFGPGLRRTTLVLATVLSVAPVMYLFFADSYVDIPHAIIAAAAIVGGLAVLVVFQNTHEVDAGVARFEFGEFDALPNEDKEHALKLAWGFAIVEKPGPVWEKIDLDVGWFAVTAATLYLLWTPLLYVLDLRRVDQLASTLDQVSLKMLAAIFSALLFTIPPIVQIMLSNWKVRSRFEALKRDWRLHVLSRRETELRKLAVGWVNAHAALWTDEAVSLAGQRCIRGLNMPETGTRIYALVSRGGWLPPEDMPGRELNVVVLGVAEYLGLRKGVVADIEGTSKSVALGAAGSLVWREDAPTERELYFSDIVTVDFSPDTDGAAVATSGSFVLKLVDGQCLEYSALTDGGVSAVEVIRRRTRAAKARTRT